MNLIQVSWRKMKLLEMLDFKTRSSRGSGMFSPELARALCTVWSLNTGFSHRRESPGESYGALFWLTGVPGTARGRKDLPPPLHVCTNHEISFLSQIYKGFSGNYRYPSLVDCFKIYLSLRKWTTATGVPLPYRFFSLTHIHAET